MNVKKQLSLDLGSDNKLEGIIKNIVFHNEENGYTILRLDTGNKDITTVIINSPSIYEGVTMEFEGEWVENEKFGRQFKATAGYEITPYTTKGLKNYLCSELFPGIGPSIADKIINHFGQESVLDVFENNLDRLEEVSGIAKKKMGKLRENWEKYRETNRVMAFLSKYEISTLFCKKILNTYGKDCVRQLKENPYRLATDIYGVGFSTADKVALKIGFEEDSDVRVSASIRYVLDESKGEGHCYLKYEQVIEKTNKLLKLNLNDKVDRLLKKLEEDGEIRVLDVEVEGEPDERRYYSKILYYNERYCARKTKEMYEENLNRNDEKINEWERNYEKNNPEHVTLSKEQKDSVVGIATRGISILTGGPGTGKSTTTRAVVDLFECLGLRVTLAAPTGRASQRMSEIIGREAQTIHRLLKFSFDGGFLFNEDNPIDTDVLIVDECSMVDINLAASLLRAVPKGGQVVLIGDADQLPPVGPGNFFCDLIDSGEVDVFRLKTIFRQAKKSYIIRHAHSINNGEIPQINSPLNEPGLWESGMDCLFIKSGEFEQGVDRDQYPPSSSLRFGFDAKGMIQRLYKKTIPDKFKNISEIQVLTPMNKNSLGTNSLNIMLQNAVNPWAKDKREIKIRDNVFREGDRIIQKVNNYDLGVFNGDIGKIQSINVANKSCVIQYGDRIVPYKQGDLVQISLAYSITIHKSQGSEFDCVIIPVMTQHYIMLTRNIIYTALTRAKKLAILVGTRKALIQAIKSVKQTERQTSLQLMLQDVEKVAY